MILQTMALLAALQGLAAAANDRRLLSQVDSSVMTINLPAKGNWKIGTTLDSFFASGSPTPFTDDSITAFEEAWNSKEFETAGSFTMTADILSSMDEKIDMLNIKGELSVSFAMFSGDAHMSFLNDNVQSDTDVSVMVKASSTGKKKQMDLSQTNILELKDSTIDELEEFEKMYGAYLIVGYIYGGEIIFESIYSANNQKDKTKVEGGLAASFNQGGFEISGSADVGYESSDTLSEVSSDTKWSMRPNVNAADDPAVNDLISTLSALARGDASDDNTLHEKLSLSAQDILSKDFVDPIQAIVVPLRSVSAVHEKFLDNPDAADTVAFMEYLNEMYLEVTARLMQIDMVVEQWSSQASEEYPVPWSTLGQWEFQLQHFKTEMSMLRSMEDIIDKSQEWHATTRSWNADVLAATSFIEIPAVTTGINYQFEQAIMGPYEKMWAAETTTQAPTTPAPTPAPTAPSYPDIVFSSDCWNNFQWDDEAWSSPDGPYANYTLTFSYYQQFTAYLYYDTTTWSSDWWIGSWNGGNWIACAQLELLDCGAGDWLYYNNGWKKDKDCTVATVEDGASSGHQGPVHMAPDGTLPQAPSRHQGPVYMENQGPSAGIDGPEDVNAEPFSIALSTKDLMIAVLAAVTMMFMAIVCVLNRMGGVGRSRQYKVVSVAGDSEMEEFQR